MNKIIRTTLLAGVVGGIALMLSACGKGSSSTDAVPAAPVASESTEPTTSAATPAAMTSTAVAGCTPLTAAATDHLVSGVPYKASGRWYAVPGVNDVGYVVGGLVTPSPGGATPQAVYTVPSLDADGFAAAKTLNNIADVAIGTSGHPGVKDPIRSSVKTDAELNSVLAAPLTALNRCHDGKSATPPPYPCAAFEEGRVDGSAADADPAHWSWSLTSFPKGYDDPATVAGWQQTVRTSCPEYTAHIDAAAAAFAKSQQVSADAAAADAAEKAKIDSGVLIHGSDHVIGSPMQPGTWQTTKDGAKDCYWSLTTSGGDIIDNDFIDFAPGRVTVDVPSSAAGFTTNGCGDFEKVG